MSKLIENTDTQNGEIDVAVWITGTALMVWMVLLVIAHGINACCRLALFAVWKLGKMLVSFTIRLPFAWTRDLVREIV